MTPEKETDAMQKDLAALNAEWDAITARRRAWMDEHMPAFARWPIGTELFYLDTGKRFGVVARYYRFHADRDPQYDRSMSIDYEVETQPKCFDNTSRLPGGSYSVGTADELIARREREAAWLKSPYRNMSLGEIARELSAQFTTPRRLIEDPPV